ncbi:MAG: ATP-binding protein [Polyangiales bacterium]
MDDEIVERYIDVLKNTLPDVEFSIDIAATATTSGKRVTLSTPGFVESFASSFPRISRSALHLSELTQTACAEHKIEITEDQIDPENEGHERYLFSNASAPIVIGHDVVGVITAESLNSAAVASPLPTLLICCADAIASSLALATLERKTDHLQDYLNKVLNFAHVPIIALSNNRGIRAVSDALSDALARPREELIGRDLLSTVAESDRVRLTATLRSTMQGRSVPPIELGLTRSDNSIARVVMKFTSILDGDDKIAGIVGIGNDITQVRTLEGQVMHVEKLATLGKLAANIVHELNNPLTSISVYADYLVTRLQSLNATSSDLQRLNKIQGSAERIAQFVRNLVTYARPSAETPRRVNVQDIIDQSIGFCHHLIEESNIDVRVEPSTNIPEIKAVPDRLQQVFVNLITNSCHAARPEGAKLTITTAYQTDGRVYVTVADNGRGIALALQERVFEPFYSTKAEGEGTGLGLSIVKSIVEQHGGSIELQSAEGRGTTFVLGFPSLNSIFGGLYSFLEVQESNPRRIVPLSGCLAQKSFVGFGWFVPCRHGFYDPCVVGWRVSATTTRCVQT